MAAQQTIEFPIAARSKDEDVIHKVLYKILASHFLNRSDLELALGDDLLDTIWQVPYDRLTEKLRKRYDKFIEGLCRSIGKKGSIQMYMFSPNIPDADDAELAAMTEAWRNVAIANQGGVPRINATRFLMEQTFATMNNLIVNEGIPTEEDVKLLDLISRRLENHTASK